MLRLQGEHRPRWLPRPGRSAIPPFRKESVDGSHGGGWAGKAVALAFLNTKVHKQEGLTRHRKTSISIKVRC